MWKLMPQLSMPLDSEGKVTLRPDLVVQEAQNVILLQIANISVRALMSSKITKPIRYSPICEAAGIRESLLIYPLHSLSSRDEIRVLRAEINVRRVT